MGPIYGGNWVGHLSTRSSTEALSFGAMTETRDEKRARFRTCYRSGSPPYQPGSRAFQPVPNLNKKSPQHSLAQSFKIPQRLQWNFNQSQLILLFPCKSEHAASYLSILQQWNNRGLGMRNAGFFFKGDFLEQF